MKNPLKNLSFQPIITTLSLAVVLVPFLNAASPAIEVPQTILNGLYSPTSAQQFFNEGRRQLELEAEILQQQRLTSPEKLLEINHNIKPVQQEKLQLQNWNPRPVSTEKARAQTPAPQS